MDPIDIPQVERRRILEHIHPVGHEADPFVGIPVEAEGKVGLPATLNVGNSTKSRLEKQEAATIEIDFANPSVQSRTFESLV